MKLPVLLCSCTLIAAGCASDDPMGGTSEAASRGSGSRVLTGGTAGSMLSQEEMQFVRDAAQSGLAEVQMGQLAQQKGQSQETKTFGQMLVTDHQAANQELMAIATRKGISIPSEMSMSDQQLVQRLNASAGEEFDRLSASENVRAHQQVIDKFQSAQERVQDPELKAFIQKTLPVLQNHLKHAQQLQGQSPGSRGGSENLETQPLQPSGSISSEQMQGTQSETESPGAAPGSPPLDTDTADRQ